MICFGSSVKEVSIAIKKMNKRNEKETDASNNAQPNRPAIIYLFNETRERGRGNKKKKTSYQNRKHNLFKARVIYKTITPTTATMIASMLPLKIP